MNRYLRKYQTAGTTQADPNAEKRKRMYDHAMEEYQFYMENPASWAEDPEMRTPDGKFNLCLDCIRVDWTNPDDIMDAHRLIEEGYSIGTHHNAEAFNNGLKALNLPPPVYNSKPVVKTAAPQKAMGGIHYGTFAPPMFAAGGMPCYECGGMYAEGGGIPERYKNMGFTHVGQKKEGDGQHKWKVLAKKGDQYKVVQGGYRGMEDFHQHHSEKRRERFWDRMGGRDSAKAKDPFSPLYWHKRFGTWAEGGELGMYDEGGPYDSMVQAGDQTLDITSRHTLNNLENNDWNRGLAITNSLVDPRSPIHYLPNKGFGSGLKAIAGLAAGLSGATLGYEKLFTGDKTDRYLYNQGTKEAGKRDDVLKDRWDKMFPAVATQTKTETPAAATNTMPYGLTPEFFQQMKNMPVKSNMTPTGGSGMGAMEREFANEPVQQPAAQTGAPATTNIGGLNIPQGLQNFMNGVQMKRNGGLTKFWPGGPFTTANGTNPIEQMIRQQSGQTGVGVQEDAQLGSYAAFNKQGTGSTQDPQWQKDYEYTQYGDPAGFVAGNNALIGLGMANTVLGQKQLQKQYNRDMVRVGNTDSMYNAVNPSNPYGNYTTNVGIGPNFALVRQTAAQDFSDANLARYGGMKKYKQGGSYMVSDKELMEILANGGDVEFL